MQSIIIVVVRQLLQDISELHGSTARQSRRCFDEGLSWGTKALFVFKDFMVDRGYQTGDHSRDGRMSDLRGLLNIHGSARVIGPMTDTFPYVIVRP